MLTVVFDWGGVVHYEYTPPGQTVNKECDLNVRRLRCNTIKMAAAMGQWWLAASSHNTPAHASSLVQRFWQNTKSPKWIISTPYSPYLAPHSFWLFPKLKSPLKGKRFQTVDEIQENMMGQLMAIPTKDFAECFEQWKRCRKNCVRSQGAYFEGDWGVMVLCTMFLVSCVIFNKCLHFSQHVAGYFLDSI